MENYKGRIKLLSQSSVDITEIEISKIDGLEKVEVNEGILYYTYYDTANDYDIMVSLMNLLESKGIECEPMFEDEEIDKDDVSIEQEETEEIEQVKEIEETNEEYEESEEYEDDEESEELAEKRERKLKFIEMCISLVLLIASFIIKSEWSVKVASYVQLVAFVVIGYEVIFEAIEKMFKKEIFSEDFLMSIASFSAIALGHTVEAIGIMLLFSVGEMFEHVVTDNSKKIIDKLKNLNPLTVNMLDENGKVVNIEPEKVPVGSIILVKAGEKIALDGEIIEGKASFDSKALTGESNLIALEQGNEVYGGYINVDGVVKIKTTKSYCESAINKIVEIVNESQEKKAKSEKFIEKFAKVYTPIVIILAILVTFVGPIFTPNYAVNLPKWALKGIMLLCISCPCAVVISIPLVYYCGLATASLKGVIVKGSNYLESLSKCKTIAFDKTGTLTEGVFEITKIQSTTKYQGKVLKYASICEKYSNHPLAIAIKNKCKDIEEGSDYKEIAGRGVSCVYNNQILLCGNAKFLTENNIKFIENTSLGMKLYVAVDNEYAGVIVLNDKIKKTSYGAILELYDAGIENTVMLTGDNKDYAKHIRKELKMKRSVSELLPQDKVKEIENLLQENKGKTVCFVGDGINDAPSLTRADVGIAMGGLGSDITIESADIVITDDDLSKIPYIIKLAKRTNKIAKQNIVLSLGIKLLVTLLALTGLSSSLWLAIGADVGVLILAILNSVRNRSKVI